MNMQKEKLKCPKCGGEMNRHGEKLDFVAAIKEPRAADPVLGGVLEEFHSCPQCGIGTSRRVPQNS